jgi:glycerol uptake operon antiterminator
VYLLCGNVLSVASLIAALAKGRKAALVNIDLLAGLSRDTSAVQFLEQAGAVGIISTNPETLRATRARGLCAVQRSFLLDSQAVTQALRALERFEPDAIELLPALAATRVVERFNGQHPRVVLTAGGLVTSLSEVDTIVRTGIRAVSVSDPDMWIA